MDPKIRTFDVIGHLASLRRYARSLARNTTDAEDLVHDALVKAYERRHTFHSSGNLRNWLMSIVHNTHIDGRRSSMARKRRDETAALEIEPAQPAGQEHAVQLAQIKAAFMDLPEEQREALHLVAVEDLSYQEAADTLGIPVGTLMSRVSRARARLRAIEDNPQTRPELKALPFKPVQSKPVQSKPAHLKLVGGSDD